MTKSVFLILISGLFFNGCGDLKQIETAAPISEGIAVRSFLCIDESPVPGYGAYGYVLFTERPGETTIDRYLEAYAAFTAVLESVDAYSDINPAQLLPTFWFLSVSRNDLGEAHSRPSLFFIENYDYARAKALLQKTGKTAVKGPVLVAWKEAFGQSNGTGETLILDLSDFSNDDMRRAIRIWADTISKDPEYWSRGFRVVKLRELLRGFLNTYGEGILAVIKPS